MFDQFIEGLEEKVQEFSHAIQSLNHEKEDVSSLIDWEEYVQDENLLIQIMNGNPPSPNDPGEIEFSWVLYFLNVKLKNYSSTGKKIYDVLKIMGMPNTQIKPGDWSHWEDELKGEGVLLGDGTLVSTQIYAILDKGWALAIFDYFLLELDLKKKEPFVTNPKLNVISGSQNSLSIAIIGDWGTGDYIDGNSPHSPSYNVMAAIQSMSPDIVIHLGDVYYAGTSTEEQDKLLNAWTYNAPSGNFTLNSNHEMYDGAKGYYQVALQSSLFNSYQTGPNGSACSYFSIEFGDFLILGLDSAYEATDKFMNGRITNSDQLSFIQNAAKQGKKIIILTHHNPIDTMGDSTNALWDDVTGANGLNSDPEMWYWGHIHNGMVYNEKAASGSTKARCLGNGAIPIGNASWFENYSLMDFYTHTPIENPSPENKLRVKNGFAVLTFSASSIEEDWYDDSGNLCWSNSVS